MVPAAMATDGEPYLQINEGQALWQEPTAGNEVVVSVELVDDLDGDGLPDVLVRSREGPPDNQTQTVIAKKGSDGTHLWEESVTGDSPDIEAEMVAADFDGDGLPDVLVQSSVRLEGNWTYATIGKKGSDGTHLWEAESNERISFPEEGDEGGEPVFRDLNGDGKADALLWISNQVCALSVGVEHPPVAEDQEVTTSINIPVSITLAATDVDGDPLTYSVVTGPSHGTLSGSAPNLTYTPDFGYHGTDSFTFKGNDGTADSNIATVHITIRVPAAVPTVSQWGIIAMSVVFVAALVWVGRGRSAAKPRS